MLGLGFWLVSGCSRVQNVCSLCGLASWKLMLYNQMEESFNLQVLLHWASCARLF